MRGKKVIYNVLSNLLLQLIIILYGFLVPRIIIRSFGSDVNGLIASVTQFLAYITLLESGFGPVVKSLLYKPIANKDSSTIEKILKASEKFFKTIAYVFLIYIILLCFIYPLIINNNFSKYYTISLIIIIGISTFAEYFFGMTYRLYIQANQKTYIISITQIVTYILSTILIVILAYNGFSIQIIKLVSALIFVLRPLFLNYYVKKKYHINLKGIDNNYDIKQKWDGLAQHIAFVIHTNTDITILTCLTTLGEVSVYSVYYLVINALRYLMLAFNMGMDATFGDMIARKELSNLNKKYRLYEIIYNTINTICFSCAIILIVPFVTIYTSGITDANYIRPLFGILIVISEYVWAIRQPYNELVKASGHFKETKTGAWIECILNITISILLVKKLGLVGVVIGTLVATLVRTIELIYHANKYILRRSNFQSVIKIGLIILETVIIIVLCNHLPLISYINFSKWIINAVMVFLVSCMVTIVINYVVFKDDFSNLKNIILKILKRKES